MPDECCEFVSTRMHDELHANRNGSESPCSAWFTALRNSTVLLCGILKTIEDDISSAAWISKTFQKCICSCSIYYGSYFENKYCKVKHLRCFKHVSFTWRARIGTKALKQFLFILSTTTTVPHIVYHIRKEKNGAALQQPHYFEKKSTYCTTDFPVPRLFLHYTEKQAHLRFHFFFHISCTDFLFFGLLHKKKNGYHCQVNVWKLCHLPNSLFHSVHGCMWRDVPETSQISLPRH